MLHLWPWSFKALSISQFGLLMMHQSFAAIWQWVWHCLWSILAGLYFLQAWDKFSCYLKELAIYPELGSMLHLQQKYDLASLGLKWSQVWVMTPGAHCL